VARSKTSLNWLKEHFNDPYVKMAQKDGYRSRASYKLLEIQERDRLIRPGMTRDRPGRCSRWMVASDQSSDRWAGALDRFRHPGNGQHP
jgi:hypothetical protein